GVPRIPHARRIREVSTLHGSHRVAACGRGSRHAPVVRAASLDLHALYLLEPMALHRAKLRVVDDVRPPRGSVAHGSRTPRTSPLVYRVVRFVDAELSHRRVR